MTTIHKTALVPYAPRQMFDLVEDIESYPEFLPWCKNARIVAREADAVQASITLARAGLEKTFVTRNHSEPGQWLEMHLIKGPFSHLYGRWQFLPLGNAGSKVSLDMEFEFSNRLVRLALEPVFSSILNSLVDAFIHRAQQRYGHV